MSTHFAPPHAHQVMCQGIPRTSQEPPARNEAGKHSDSLGDQPRSNAYGGGRSNGYEDSEFHTCYALCKRVVPCLSRCVHIRARTCIHTHAHTLHETTKQSGSRRLGIFRAWCGDSAALRRSRPRCPLALVGGPPKRSTPRTLPRRVTLTPGGDVWKAGCQATGHLRLPRTPSPCETQRAAPVGRRGWRRRPKWTQTSGGCS